ncbi:MAG: DNA cytosine methyltransferase [Pseudomonadales bacterium]
MATGVDLFAGLGGNTTGAKQVGIDILWAANHKRMAVDFHELNHPEVQHRCQDLQQADWSLLPSHDVMLASPCCQGHTKARGKEGPYHHKSRATAWAPVDCAAYHNPELVMIENVTELLKWSLFPHWKSCWNTMGYSLSINILDAADYGIPQHRNRVFIIGTKSKSPIQINLNKVEHTPISQVIDLNAAKWSLVEKPGRAKTTLSRVANGRKSFGDTFVMPYYTSGSGLTGRSIDRPIGTVTTKDRWAVVNGDKMRMFTVEEYRQAMSFPKSTILPKRKDHAIHFLGNATCPELVSQVLETALKAA